MNYVLDFRGADTGGPVLPGRILPVNGVQLGTEDDLRHEAKITFLVHGFNVNREEGRNSLLQLATLLPAAADGAIVIVLWPGDHWVGPINYPFEGNDADDSASEMTRFIDRVVTPGSELHFISHSLGARVVLETVKALQDGRYKLGQVCLMAAAIDDFSLADSAEYRSPTTRSQRVTVLASHEDLVLRLAYPLGDLLQAFFFFWKDEVGLALGYHGPRPAGENSIPEQVYHVQIPDARNAGHGDYLPGQPSSGDYQSLQNRRSAAQFADQVIQGAVKPQYP
jgi:hypothetical protein